MPAASATSSWRLTNATRRENGLPPVVADGGLEQVARAHSQDMVQHDFVGHTSPTTGTAVQRVARAGYNSGLVLENIGRGYGAREIEEGLMQSPGHRANILNPDVTHVGIGVVAQQEGIADGVHGDGGLRADGARDRPRARARPARVHDQRGPSSARGAASRGGIRT